MTPRPPHVQDAIRGFAAGIRAYVAEHPDEAAEVKLEIDPRLAVIGARPERLRCTHRLHPRLLSGDLARIEDAKAHVAAAETVALAAFVQRNAPDDRTTAAAP